MPPSLDETDADAPLVRRAQAGDRAAFEMLVLKYQRRVERLIARSLRDVDLVADVAQDTFLRAYRALPGFRFESAFYTWLYRIAVNTTRRQMERLQRDPLTSQLLATSPHTEGEGGELLPAEPAPSDHDTPETLLAGKELAQAVSVAVEALPEEHRRALLLRELDGMGYEEIAELMQCPVGTVRSRIFRAREAVAAKLRPLLGHGLGGRAGGRW